MRIKLYFGVFAMAATVLTVCAEVVPHALFSDHCVLQRGEGIPVWGTAGAGEKVLVRFRGVTAEAVAQADGQWMVKMDTGEAGGPFDLVIEGEHNEVRVQDVLVGEVWLASGQSNMEWTLASGNSHSPMINGNAAAAKADYPMLRQFKVPRTLGLSPQKDVKASWLVCTPETASQFTAVGFFFARDLLKSQGVPVGIVNSSWGGTPAQAWTSEEELSVFSRYEKDLAAVREVDKNPEQAEAMFEKRVETWFEEYDSSKGASERFAVDFDDREWSTVPVPSTWEDIGLAEFDGIAWYRAEFDLPENWSDQDLTLEMGRIDDCDTTWINGVRVGQTPVMHENRVYAVSGKILRTGRNVIAIRMLDRGFGGGFADADKIKPSLRLSSDKEATMSLPAEWRFKTFRSLSGTDVFPMQVHLSQHTPTGLFNGMIAPLIPYAVRGVIWYQGESNAGDATHYLDLFPAMIADWRRRWGQGDFPFLYVQIAPYKGQPPEIREAQLLTLEKTLNTAMVVTIDVGDPEDIHPANKEPVGERLALAARALAYGEDIVYSGPVYESMRVEGSKAVLSFTSVGPGLVAGGEGALRGFVIAGEDGVWHPAKAEISGSEVIVRSEQVGKPTAVRYGWAHVADGNLFNKAGLPASPFRTDVPAGSVGE